VSSVRKIARQPDGKMIIAGLFDTYNGMPRRSLARVNPDGSLDPSFDPVALGFANVLNSFVSEFPLALQLDGKILVGGGRVMIGVVGIFPVMARLNHDGTLDGTFDTGDGGAFDTVETGQVNAISLQADGQVIIGGSFRHYKGTACNNIVRLLPAPGAISFSSPNFSAGEGAGTARLTLTRTGGTDNTVHLALVL